jgi:hypothetical protein
MGLDVYKRKPIIFLVLLTYQLVIYLVQARGAVSSVISQELSPLK